MFATDFIFNGQRASDFDLVICSFDGEYTTATGGDAEFNVVKSPDSDKFNFYGAQYNTPLEWTFSIIKNPCILKNDSKTDDFSNEEERIINKWLARRDGYHWLNFCQDENEDDILYKVQIKVRPRQVAGKTIGFDLTVTADSAFGYTPLQKKKATINKTKPLVLHIDNDTDNYILPKVTIQGQGNFYIANNNDVEMSASKNKAPKFTDILSSDKILMDSENKFLNGISFDKFNCRFLRLVDGKNVITTDSESDINLEIYYREVRRVIV